MQLKEKRLYPRIKLKAALHLVIRGRGECSDTVTEDISAGGICFIQNGYIAPLTNLMLKLKVLSQIMNPVGKVVWVSPVAHSDRYRMGVEFIELDPEKKSYLSEYILMQENML